MSKEMVTQEQIPRRNRLSAVEIKADVQLIQEVMKSVMKNGVHYGTIPGCGDKPTLLKSGAEKIAMTFKLSTNINIEDLSTEDEIRYRIKTVLINNTTGNIAGTGIGECSSNETKYKWRKAVCPEEFEETPEDRKREKWVIGYRGSANKKIKQVRVEIADIANTILKMGKKRSMVDAVLTTTGASDIFSQDLEDINIEPIQHVETNSEIKKPEPVKYPEIMILSKQVFTTQKDYLIWLELNYQITDRKKLTEKQAIEAEELLKIMLEKEKFQPELDKVGIKRGE